MKKTIVLNESDLHRIISESVKRILNEGFFNRGNSNQQNGQQQRQQPNLPKGVYDSIDGATFGYASSETVPIYTLSTNIGNLYVGGNATRNIKTIMQELQQNGINVFNCDNTRVKNPHYNGYNDNYDNSAAYQNNGSYRQTNRTTQGGHIRPYSDELAAWDF